MMQWTEEMSVGVAVLDEDHKKLFAMINELSEAIQVGHGKHVLAGILDRLTAYTVEHFGREEGLLTEAGYPSLDVHHRVHEKLTADVAAMRRKLEEGDDVAMPIDLLQFLQSWLANHIMLTDKLYSEHLHAHGIR